MTALLLRLAGPLQSWGDHSTFAERDTGRYPTRSGMIGMIAAAQGRRRVDPVDDLTALRFTIRVDRPGERIVDFHTIGGGLTRDRTVPTSEGGRRQPGAETIVSRRAYLADAAFTICVQGPTDVVTAAANALRRPTWAPFLGRRSCPAETPMVLRLGEFDGEGELHTSVPVSRHPWDRKQVTFVYDRTPPDAEAAHHLELNDEPISFDPRARRYAARVAYVRRVDLPEELSAGVGRRYLEALLRQYSEEGMS